MGSLLMQSSVNQCELVSTSIWVGLEPSVRISTTGPSDDPHTWTNLNIITGLDLEIYCLRAARPWLSAWGWLGIGGGQSLGPSPGHHDAGWRQDQLQPPPWHSAPRQSVTATDSGPGRDTAHGGTAAFSVDWLGRWIIGRVSESTWNRWTRRAGGKQFRTVTSNDEPHFPGWQTMTRNWSLRLHHDPSSMISTYQARRNLNYQWAAGDRDATEIKLRFLPGPRNWNHETLMPCRQRHGCRGRRTLSRSRTPWAVIWKSDTLGKSGPGYPGIENVDWDNPG